MKQKNNSAYNFFKTLDSSQRCIYHQLREIIDQSLGFTSKERRKQEVFIYSHHLSQ